jgi:hypothetical protein
MNNDAKNCGDSNHMRRLAPNVEFLRGRKLYKERAALLHTAAAVGCNPRFPSRRALWNESQALCI